METAWGLLSTALCLSHALFLGSSDASPSFRLEPLSTVQKQGGVVHLRCSVRSPAARLSWHFRGKMLDSGTAGVKIKSGSLTLLSLQPDQMGYYQCVAHTESGTLASRLALVTIAEISEFAESQRRSVTVEEGSSVVIQCPMPHSVPPALTRIRVRGEWLENSTDDYLILPSGNLHIMSASRQHQGTYKCGAYNPLTGETRSQAHGTKLTVKTSSKLPPVHIVHPVAPQTLTVVQSENLTLECLLAGAVPPTAHWMKDGEEVVTDDGRKLLHNNLVLTGVSKSDEGLYWCSAQTESGLIVSANYTVNVLEPASVLKGLTDHSAMPGSTVLFTCHSKGSPAPNITWLFNSAPIRPSSQLQIFGSSLRLYNVTPEDQGIYQCLLDNGVGSAQSASVLAITSGVNSLPVILSPPISGIFLEGDSVSLSCNASGHPSPVIRWYNAGGLIASHPSHLLQAPKAKTRATARAKARASAQSSPFVTVSWPGSSSLFIQPITASLAGKYICEASNSLGSVRSEAFVSVVTVANLTTNAPTSTGPLQNDAGEELFTQGEEPGETQGIPTEKTSDLHTPEAPIITSPPLTHKHNVYDLEWRAGKDWGSPINAYFVKYRKQLEDLDGGAGSWHTVRVPGSEKSLRLSDLEPSSLYEVLMVARSTAGASQPAMLTFRTGKERVTLSSKTPSKAPFLALPEKTPEHENTHFGVVIHDRVPEAPDKPTVSMATENSVYVTWIPRANGGSPITAFRVEFRRQGRSAEWIVAADNISPLKLSVEVPNLEPGSTYRFRVIAINMYGESPHSFPSKAYQVSPVNPPLSVRPVAGPHISSTDAVSDTQIMLRWTYTPSSNNNTPIQGFYIYYRPTDSDNDSDYKRDVVEGNRYWHLIGQLQPETSYDIKMQCFNNGGESDYSNVMICETKARQTPGVVPENPITPPGPFPPEPSMPPGGLLYLIVGSVLGVMVLILLVFIAMCLWRNRQQSVMHKYDPPGYLYQPAEINGLVQEYGTLPSRANGSVHGSYGHVGSLSPPSCPHLHHKLPNGVPLLNGLGVLYPTGHTHTHNGPLHGTLEYDHSHSLDRHNGSGMYAPLPQSEPSECMSCQNFCNNNRCFTKTKSTFPSGSLPIMHHMKPCQQEGLELLPLARVTSHCHGSGSLQCPGEEEEAREEEGTQAGQEPEAGQTVPPPTLHTCCQAGEIHLRGLEEGDEEVAYEPPRVWEMCWEGLERTSLDCSEKAVWVAENPAPLPLQEV